MNNDEVVEKIKQYKELLDSNAITEEEYNLMKRRLFSELKKDEKDNSNDSNTGLTPINNNGEDDTTKKLIEVFAKYTEEALNPKQYIIQGDIVYFGSYPQSKVSDYNLIIELNRNIDKSKKIIDIEYNGNHYRKVNDDWFKFDPIEWKIIEEKNGNLLLRANSYLDVQKYGGTSSKSCFEYKNSYIRKWLNKDFYNSAFNSENKKIIKDLTLFDKGNKEVVELKDKVSVVSSATKGITNGFYNFEEFHYYHCTEYAGEHYNYVMLRDKNGFTNYLNNCTNGYACCQIYDNKNSYFDDWHTTNRIIYIEKDKTSYVVPIICISTNNELDDSIIYADDLYKSEYLAHKKLLDTILKNRKKRYKKYKNKVFLGNYFVHDNKQKEPIEWDILEEENGKALLISHYILDLKKTYNKISNDESLYYNKKTHTYYSLHVRDYPYASSDLRSWLTNDFYNSTFDDLEKSIIKVTSIGNNCNDNVFLISEEELKKYYANDIPNVKYSPYAVSKATESSLEKPTSEDWWIRDKKFVSENKINYGNDGVKGVRPAIWIDLNKLELLQNGVKELIEEKLDNNLAGKKQPKDNNVSEQSKGTDTLEESKPIKESITEEKKVVVENTEKVIEKAIKENIIPDTIKCNKYAVEDNTEKWRVPSLIGFKNLNSNYDNAIIIPKSVIIIIAEYHTSFKNIFYDGNISDWIKVIIKNSDNWNCTRFTADDSKFYYSDDNGDVILNGKKYILAKDIVLPEDVLPSSYSLNYLDLKKTEYGGYVYVGTESNPYKILFNSISKYEGEVKIHDSCEIIYNKSINNFENNVIIPSNVKYIYPRSFVSDIESIKFPKDLTIMEEAFYDKMYLTEVEFQDGVTIDDKAFYNTNLSDAFIPAIFRSINYGAFGFDNCFRKKLKGVIKAHVAVEKAFNEQYKKKNIKITNGVTIHITRKHYSESKKYFDDFVKTKWYKKSNIKFDFEK